MRSVEHKISISYIIGLVGLLSNKKDKKAMLKALSGLSINLSAAWYAVVFIVPNFSRLSSVANLLVLTIDLIFGTFCLWLSFKIERQIL